MISCGLFNIVFIVKIISELSLSTKFHITKLIVEVEYVIELSYMNV